jgi:hypothetical protein
VTIAVSVSGGLYVCFYRNNVEGAEDIRAMILSGDVSDDDSTDDGKECDGDDVEASGGVPDCAEDVMKYD